MMETRATTKKSDSIKLMKIMDNINKKFGDSKLSYLQMKTVLFI